MDEAGGADEVILDPEGMEAVIKAVEHIRAKINKPLVHAVSESLIKTMASMNAANADRVMIVAMVFATQMMDAPPLMREAMFGAVVILAGEVMEFMEAADLKAAASAPLAEREAEGNG